MTIRARIAGKWRRGLAALAASGALLAGGLAVAAPAQAEQNHDQTAHADGASFAASGTAGQKNNATTQYNTHLAACEEQGFVCPESEQSEPEQNAEGKWAWSVTGTKNLPPVCEGDEELNETTGECEINSGPPPPSPEYQDITPLAGTPPSLENSDPPGAAAWTGDLKAIAPPPIRSAVNCTMIGNTWAWVADTTPPGGIWCGKWVSTEPDQQFTPPPPCWDPDVNNCPVGGAFVFAAPEYAIVGVPVTLYAYASWKPDANSPAQPTDGSAVIRVDGEDYSGVAFNDGVAQWRFIPKTPGVKEFTVSGVVFSGLSGANAYIDTVPASVTVLAYDPAAFAKAFAKKRVEIEVDSPYTIVDRAQAAGALAKRLQWRVTSSSDNVCAVYETKRGAVRLKFTDSGKCKVIWEDPKTGDEGKYTFIAKK